MNQCTMREARITDSDSISTLVGQLGYPASPSEMTERLKILLAHADYMTLVAETSNQVVGMIGVYTGHAFEFSGTYGMLTGVAVDSDWRGRGIGRLMMETLESRLKERGTRILIVTSGIQRNEAHLFYKALGYEQTGLRFAKQL